MVDTGLRPPTEINNIRVSDLSKDCKELNIRDEIVKHGSFGRSINLVKSQELIRTYIKTKNLSGDDFLFNVNSTTAGKYLKRHAKDLFGTNMTRGGKPYHKISLYSFRHIATCYWSTILNKDRDIMHRMGWKQSNKIYYYSKFIKDEDESQEITIDTETAELQRRLELTEKNKSVLEDKYQNLENQVSQMAEIIKEVKSMLKAQQVQPAVQVT